ncbi:MAG: hypothetical protein IPO20_10295 [Gammaproteobacteria bacterium]|nr:hypothetical protein [Gammaproteobacteria bacterium]
MPTRYCAIRGRPRGRAIRAYRISTVDINQAFELPTRSDVLAWIRAAEYKSRTRHGRPQMKGGTIYWGKHSQRWALKAYSKGRRDRSPQHRLREALLDNAAGEVGKQQAAIRTAIEEQRARETSIETAADLTPVRARQLYGEYVGRLDMKEQNRTVDRRTSEAATRLRGTYALWRCGEDLRSTLPKATYFRHRKAFLEYGIDIALRQESLDRSNVVPLIRILQAEPASIPEWAFAQRLVHRSARSPRVAASA